MNASNERMEVDDAAIVGEIRAGNVEAFRLLVDRHSRSLFRMAYRMTGNEHDAEDVVQETLMKAYRDIGRFEARSNFSTWLYRIGANCALDLLRSRRLGVLSECRVEEEQDDLLESIPARDPSPDQAICNSKIRQRLATALDTLSAAERAAFVLRHFQQVPIAEIGRMMGLRENATKNTIFRAVQKLRGALEPVIGELR